MLKSFEVYSKEHLEDVWKRMRVHAATGKQKELPVGIDGICL